MSNKNRSFTCRGIPLFGEKFVKGNLIVEENEKGEEIFTIRRNENGKISYFEVKKETIGISTGFEDVKKNEIFEGDYLQRGSSPYKYIVLWNEDRGYLYLKADVNPNRQRNVDYLVGRLDLESNWLILGNIHENPELVKFRNLERLR